MSSARCAIALLAVVVAAGSMIPACAKDAGLDGGSSGGASGDSGTAASGGGSGDASWPIGGFGAPCNSDSDCSSKQCTDIGQNKPNKVCTFPCGAPCPTNGYCAFLPDKGYTCVPDNGNQCSKCTTSAECPNKGDICAISPKLSRFCARDCSKDGNCPSGMTCVAVSGYPPGNGTDPPDAGAGEAGAPTSPLRMCVPEGGESCPCVPSYDGATRKCTAQSGSLVCEGTESCDGASGKWEGCTAGSPKPEVCDGVDNDCNGTPDDAPASELCKSQGTLPNGTWKCDQGACLIGECNPGWTHYPPSSPQSAGCNCQLEATEPNDTCADAGAAGSVTDANTTALTITGRLASDTDEDWWTFDTVDYDEGTTNSYHIRIVFSAPANNSEFVFDVIRGNACAVPDAKHSNLTEYDWCVDGQGTVGGQTIGEQSCGPTAAIHCGPHDKKYFVRVKRKAGAAGTCNNYTLTVTAKGGGTCDFTKACDPQVSEI